MLTNTALVITSVDDISLVDKYPGAKHIALDRSIMQLCKECHLKHILHYCDFKSDFYDTDIACIIANKWYRGEDGIDLSIDEFSMGLTLEYRLSESIASAIRYYCAFKGILDIYSEVIIPNNIPKLLKDVLSTFGDRIKFIHSNNDIYEVFNFPIYRNSISRVKIHWLSPIAHFLQKFYFKSLTNRVLFFSDWTYKYQKNNSFLFMNLFNITKSYYLTKPPKSSIVLTDDIVLNKDIEANVKNTLKRFSKKYDKSLSKLIFRIIKDEYYLLKSDAIYMYSMYKDLLGEYKPKAVVIYNTTYPWHVIVMQIANTMQIPVAVAQDGFPVYANKYNFSNDRSGLRPLVKNYFVMGCIGRKLMSGSNFTSINKVQIKPPLLDYCTNTKNNGQKNNTALILFDDPPISNLLTEWDYRYQHIVNIIKCLADIGISDVTIKIKEGADEIDILTLQKVLHNYSDIAVIGGKLSEHIHLFSLVVGSLGSAIAEVIYTDTPYYIFEPYYNGITDKTLYESSILSLGKGGASRDINELKKNILTRNSFLIDKEELADGANMSDINFDNLVY